jgi:hypothetical protein
MTREFSFDVAISFAGEQRREAEGIAGRLRVAGVSVFYDAYEQADLWGKNLIDHLGTVYQHKAQYCLMLVSAAYAAKIWTTYERQSAQARALSQKTEYILPVRFDKTEIPGLLHTIAYVDFAAYGVDGIADLLLQKLGKPTGAAGVPSALAHVFHVATHLRPRPAPKPAGLGSRHNLYVGQYRSYVGAAAGRPD